MLLKENIPLKYVFGKIKYEVLLVAVYTLFIVLLHSQFKLTNMEIPLAVPMIMGTVISLLLAFRSNQAYDRWWEARTIWGAIVNDSRSLSRQILSFIDDREDTVLFREKLVRRQIAWCYALSQSLRGLDAKEGLERLLSKREMAFISKYTSVPMALLELHARDLNYALKQEWLNEYQQVELDRTLSRLCDAMGKCERIKNTVFPATYSLYIHFSMNFFILLLPFALIQNFGVLAIPMVVAISASFLLIEKMAIHLQDPFDNKPTDTPMTAISRNIERDLKQMLNDHQIPESEAVYKYYVM
ncbi:putative membrane protein [Chitinophaga sp. YR573]|jgi:putative membrane protein|uniref:bestrophin family protein n=1 Tax=Chitinophaga sp. YR573 TaxID=1881040 RepID=UPI0008BF17C3|nr:bestrophin family ion channel [Chitinophaga sp. YR573]SEW16328.1 putative membrane protein [Chitinophaga sp. YR573]